MVWQMKKLGDVCDIIGGGTPSKSNEEFYTGDIPWATVRDMRSENLSETEFKITEKAVRSSSTNVISKDNVIIATRVGLGKVCLLKQNTAINQDLRAVIPKSSIRLDRKFLFWWLKSVASDIQNEGTGATVKGVKLPFIKSLLIPVPPLAEQKKIVAILDEAFANIDHARQLAERNFKNTRELFDSTLNQIFMQCGEGDVEKPLSTFCEKVSTGPFGTLLHKSDYKSLGTPLINPINIIDQKIVPDNEKRVDELKLKELSNYVLRTGDVIIARRGEIGRCAEVHPENDGWLCGTGSFFIRPKSILSGKYLSYLLSSGIYRKKLETASTGATMSNLSNTALASLIVTVPSLEKQFAELDKIESIKTQTRQIEAIYQQKITALNELKQSLLQKAFRGELMQAQTSAA